MRENYNFNISLSVLNHLGRNLYRNIVTVLGEAISNSWDADAKNVYITINKEQGRMSIRDDGTGMTDDDFQDKFLKIGYSKRKSGSNLSAAGRPYIGRKGIGKLALLSCAKKITIASKTEGGALVGGVIDNAELDAAITDDLNAQQYMLGKLDESSSTLLSQANKGTIIVFDTLTDGILNTADYIKKAIAMYFRFSLVDKNFSIYVNGERITEQLLSQFSDNTQFLWKINNISDPFLDTMKNLQASINLKSDSPICGYIASVKKPSNIKIRGTQEKATIDLFVNGRLREKDILRHIPTARIVESYVYGQIHCDTLDSKGSKDIFTSSREGIISDDPQFAHILEELERLFKKIIDEWDILRRKHGDDGDPDNQSISKKARKAQELFNTTVEDFEGSSKLIKKGSVLESWVQALSEEAQFNVPSYTECFISENLLRSFIKYTNMDLSDEALKEAAKWKKAESENKAAANISFDIRTSSENMAYLDMKYLSNMVDKAQDKLKDAALSRSAVIYKPMRDAVGHTSLLTENAKTQLSLEYENIKARLSILLKEITENKT